MKNMTKFNKFILTIILQIFVILAIIIFKLSILGNGTEVLLQIRPVDPTSPLRGDYITFHYDISSIDSYLFQNKPPRNGDTVYVTLTQSGKYWRARSASVTKPTNGVFITGRVVGGGSSNEPETDLYRPTYGRILVMYGIEQYFVPEGKGRNFSFWNKDAAVSVSVAEDGKSVLKKVYVDGNVWP